MNEELLVLENHTLELSYLVSTTHKYFGIDDVYSGYTQHINKFGRMEKLNSNQEIMSYTNIVEFVKHRLQNSNKELIEVFISKELQSSIEIKDSFNNYIFRDEPILKGWLVFIDKCKIANWSHMCDYLIVANEDNYIEKKDEGWKPNKNINMIKIDI